MSTSNKQENRPREHAHPLIYMTGMNVEDLLAIVDFLYYGEANIYQENLHSFLTIAEELELKGLNGREEGGGKERGDGEIPQHNYQSIVPSPHTYSKNGPFEKNIISQENSFLSQSHHDKHILPRWEVVVPKQHFSGDIKELDVQIDMIIGRGENMVKGNGKGLMVKVYVWQACGKEGARNAIRQHIEVNHFEGFSIPCNRCEKTFMSRIP